MYAKLLVAVGLLSSGVAHATDITYNIDIAYSNVSVIGTITTDGTIGTLSDSDYTDFNVVITEGTNSMDVNPLTGREESFGGTTATATGLFLDFSSANYFLLQDGPPGYGYMCLQGPGGFCDDNGATNAVGNISIQEPYIDDFGAVENMSGVQQFATASLTSIPEPSSLVLLGTSLLGAIGAVRKRFA